MSFLEILLQIGTVFLGAFLAFWLENLRERRQLKRWASDYLRQIRSQMTEHIDSQENTLVRLTATREVYEKLVEKSDIGSNNDIEWDKLAHMFYGGEDDYSFLLRSEVVQVLPADFAQALVVLERAEKLHGVWRVLVNQIHQSYVIPLMLNPHLPLTLTEKLGVGYCLDALGYFIESKQNLVEKSKKLELLLDKHNLGR